MQFLGQASVAQLVEQLFRKQQVWSSSLHAGSTQQSVKLFSTTSVNF